MKKHLLYLFIGMVTIFTACSSQTELPEPPKQTLDSGSKPTVALTVWAPTEYAATFATAFDAFEAENSHTVYEIEFEAVERDALLDKLESGTAPDIFVYELESFDALLERNSLLEIVRNIERINGEHLENALTYVTDDNSLYGYPLASDNSTLFFYDSAHFNEAEVSSFDGLFVTAQNNKVEVILDLKDSLTITSFFASAGLTVAEEDGVISTDYASNTGISIATKLATYAQSESYKADLSTLSEDLEEGSVAAGLIDSSLLPEISAAIGETLVIAPLPKISIGTAGYPLASPTTFDYVGVSPQSGKIDAIALAEYLSTNQDLSIPTDYAPTFLSYASSAEVSADEERAAKFENSKTPYVNAIRTAELATALTSFVDELSTISEDRTISRIINEIAIKIQLGQMY